jgi:hypothetical protein
MPPITPRQVRYPADGHLPSIPLRQALPGAPTAAEGPDSGSGEAKMTIDVAKISYVAAKISFAVGSRTITVDKICQNSAKSRRRVDKFSSAAASIGSTRAKISSISVKMTVSGAERGYDRANRTIALAKFSCNVAKFNLASDKNWL